MERIKGKVGKVKEATTPRPAIEVPIKKANQKPAPKQTPVKSLLITTDGSNVNVQSTNLNYIEMEMMLIKVLARIRERK